MRRCFAVPQGPGVCLERALPHAALADRVLLSARRHERHGPERHHARLCLHIPRPLRPLGRPHQRLHRGLPDPARDGRVQDAPRAAASARGRLPAGARPTPVGPAARRAGRRDRRHPAPARRGVHVDQGQPPRRGRARGGRHVGGRAAEGRRGGPDAALAVRGELQGAGATGHAAADALQRGAPWHPPARALPLAPVRSLHLIHRVRISRPPLKRLASCAG